MGLGRVSKAVIGSINKLSLLILFNSEQRGTQIEFHKIPKNVATNMLWQSFTICSPNIIVG